MQFLPLEQHLHRRNRQYLLAETIESYRHQYYANSQVSNFVRALTDLRDQLQRSPLDHPDRVRVYTLISKYRRMIRTQSMIALRKENLYKYNRQRLEEYTPGYSFEPERLHLHQWRSISSPKYYSPPQIFPLLRSEDPAWWSYNIIERDRRFRKNRFLRHSPT